jgi:hypothetical protein
MVGPVGPETCSAILLVKSLLHLVVDLFFNNYFGIRLLSCLLSAVRTLFLDGLKYC